ncbi:MAG: ribosomal RNA small subunit methyltransferase A [Calditrichaeota bacterium]|nr:MAG: ribosomal RNA small subunit methyltransferase A [Calditrichota bacterium]
MRAKQSLGQNFLIDENIALKIVHSINPGPEETLLEIGPGQGRITRLLQPRVKRLLAVEIDQRLYPDLERTFAGCDNFQLIKADFLEIDLAALASEKLRVFGNIPYNITSPILFKIFEQRRFVHDVVLLMQKEVAQRIVSTPDSKDYGILAVMCQIFADVKLLFNVPPTVFRPQPRVDSSLVQLRISEERTRLIVDEPFLRFLVRTAFGQRRKMLRNSLKEFADQDCFDFTRRPENVTIAEWISLANELYPSSQRQTAVN